MATCPDAMKADVTLQPWRSAAWKFVERWFGHSSCPVLARKWSSGGSAGQLRRQPWATAGETSTRSCSLEPFSEGKIAMDK